MIMNNCINSLDNEIWYNLPDYEEYYEISSLGRIKSRARKVKTKGNVFRSVPSKILSNKIHTGGYTYTQLNIDGKAKNITIHIYLAKLFIPNPDNKPFINHKDGIKTNNSIDNLEWVTHSENMQHAFDNKLQEGRKGIKHHNVKLTEDNIIEIRKRLLEGETQQSLADEFKVHNVTISNINLRRSWNHI